MSPIPSPNASSSGPSTRTSRPRVRFHFPVDRPPLLTGQQGVSLITQSLYTLVFLTRYTDIFGPVLSLWNLVLKVFYILSSFYILYLMLRVYARTREREKAWKLGGACVASGVILSPLIMMVFERKFMWGLQEVWPSTLSGRVAG